MITVQRAVIGLFLGACVLSSIGCGGPYNSDVSGNVTLDGETVPRGTVSFVPVGKGSSAYGRIDSSGNYFLRTGREEGLPAGEYAVSVVANELPDMSKVPEGTPPPPGKPITPPWYRSQTTSGLKFTVEPGGNQIDLQLTSDPPADWKPTRRRR